MIEEGAPPTGQLEEISSKVFENLLNSPIYEIRNKRVFGKVDVSIEKTEVDSVHGCVFEDEVVIHCHKSAALRFYDCELKGEFTLSSREKGTTALFQDCRSVLAIRADNLNSAQIIIFNSVVEEQIEFILCSHSILHVRSSTIKGSIKFESHGFPIEMDTVRISYSSCENMSLDYGISFEKILLENGSFGLISANSIVKSFSCIGYSISIDRLLIGTHGDSTDVLIANAKIDQLVLDYEIGKSSSFRIFNSKMKSWSMKYAAPNDLQALNLDLSDCSLFFDNSLLSNCTFSNISWPSEMKLCSIHPEGSKEKFTSLREAYRQLKKAMLNDRNNFDALIFYRNEMEAHWAYIRHPKANGLHRSLALSWFYNLERGLQDWQNKMLMWLGYHVSDHGQSLLRPLFWLFFFHFILFFILVLCGYNEFSYSWSDASWVGFRYHVGHFFMLLNPAHSVPTEAKNFTDGMLGIDFLMRLSSAFFIYHIIRASRKFAKL